MAASNPTFNNAAFSDFGGAASDLFAAQGDKSKQQFDYSEASNYELGANLADQNAKFTETSTAIKEAQQQRELTMSMGQTTADVAGAGFSASGSALDIMRDSASQGALAHAVLGQQGLITEAGYKEQADSYNAMATAATQAGNAEGNAAVGSEVTSGIKAIAGIASIALAPVTGGASLLVGAAATSAMGDASGIGGLY
jgi:dsDNA-binding SOS-regulon protein